MAAIKKIKLYRFNELEKGVQQKLVEQEQDIDMYQGWEENIKGDLKYFLNLQNISFQNLEYSGFYCQGDGARVTCDIYGDASIGFLKSNNIWDEKEFKEKVEKNCPMFTPFADEGSFWDLCRKETPNLINDISRYVDYEKGVGIDYLQVTMAPINSWYYHENTLISSVDIGGNDDFEDEEVMANIDKLESQFAYYVKILSKFTYRLLMKEYEGYMDEDNIREYLESNGYVYTKYGVYLENEIVPDE